MMQNPLKKYYSLVLLFLYLFPQVEKGIHNLYHERNAACDTKNNEISFNAKQHSCFICDSNLADIHGLAGEIVTVHIKRCPTSYIFYSHQISVSHFDYQLPARAPPFI